MNLKTHLQAFGVRADAEIVTTGGVVLTLDECDVSPDELEKVTSRKKAKKKDK